MAGHDSRCRVEFMFAVGAEKARFDRDACIKDSLRAAISLSRVKIGVSHQRAAASKMTISD